MIGFVIKCCERSGPQGVRNILIRPVTAVFCSEQLKVSNNKPNRFVRYTIAWFHQKSIDTLASTNQVHHGVGCFVLY
jgi:hypothetical protein